MSVMNYKQNLVEKGDLADPSEAQTDAVIIYEKLESIEKLKIYVFCMVNS